MIKNYLTKCYNYNVALSNRKCSLYGVVVSANGDAGEVKVYAGENANGELKAVIEVLDGDTKNISFVRPIVSYRGIFITVNAATTYFTATLKLHDEMDSV